jgi:glucose/arabinose dehydrogenase
MHTVYGWGLGATFILLAASNVAVAAIAGLERVAQGLSAPVYVTQAPNDTDRLFVVEKGGAIKIVDLNTNTVSGTFMTIDDTDPDGEGGLIGMAFHPNYSNEGETGFGKFYVYVTVDNGGIQIDGVTSPFTSRIREYTAIDADTADEESANEILSWVQPRNNHNGGWIGFNPIVTQDEAQYLYINSGDGGKQNDPDNNAQTLTNEKLGKVLRIDVNGDDFAGDDARDYAIPPDNPFVGVAGDDEIWAYGLRNPWRGSFDRLTGDYWVGDVGQNAREEVSVVDYEADGPSNFGWRRFEGNLDSSPTLPVPADYVPPVYDYERTVPAEFNGQAVNGGYVYRGPDPDLQGLYFFSDSQVSNIWTIDTTDLANAENNVDNIETELGSLFASVNVMVSFGEDSLGNLYIVDYLGEVYRILTNKSFDGDYNLDGVVDAVDYTVWRNHFGTDFEDADGDNSGTVDAGDYTVWKDNYGASVHDLGAGSGGLSNVPEPCAILLAGQLLMLGLLGSRSRAKIE